MDQEVHVLPPDDARVHEPTRDCWCQPWCVHEHEDAPLWVVHHSIDAHELIKLHGIN